MASKHTTIKRTLRGRLHTRSRDIARTIKYAAVDVDFDALQRELCTTNPFTRQRTLGGNR
jgi:Protein of unknown function (DUF3073)